MQGKVDVLLGLQWGDEGKGKIVDFLTPQYDYIARFQGGPNAGHTIKFNEKEYVLRSIPSGIFQCKGKNIIGNGVVFDPIVFKEELDRLIEENDDKSLCDKIIISRHAHIIIPTHKVLDEFIERYKANNKGKVGTTLKGIGPAYADKYSRIGLMMKDIFDKDFGIKYNDLADLHRKEILMYENALENDNNVYCDFFAHFSDLSSDLMKEDFKFYDAVKFIKENIRVCDVSDYLNEELNNGKSVLAEGAQGTLLDIDFGSYPYVTSSHTISSGACVGLGVAPNKIRDVYGVFKAYCTRVGEGPFPTELNGDDGREMREKGHEYGSVTKRPRRCGWLDLVALKKACQINGVTKLVMMKADVLDDFSLISACKSYTRRINNNELCNDLEYEHFQGWRQDISKCKTYEELPENFKKYVKYIEDYTGVEVFMISTGPDRENTIIKNKSEKDMDKSEPKRDMNYIKNETKVPKYENYPMKVETNKEYYTNAVSLNDGKQYKNACYKMSDEHAEFKRKLNEVLNSLNDFLVAKNQNYGNSALNPVGIFSKGGAEDGILRRMDDKLNRIKNSDVLRKNDIVDLMGYLAILCINKNWTKFNEFVD